MKHVRVIEFVDLVLRLCLQLSFLDHLGARMEVLGG